MGIVDRAVEAKLMKVALAEIDMKAMAKQLKPAIEKELARSLINYIEEDYYPSKEVTKALTSMLDAALVNVFTNKTK